MLLMTGFRFSQEPDGADIQYTAQDDGKTLTLKIFSGKDAAYSLYEDDGLTYGYERGEYCRYPMVWNDETTTLTIKAREGSFKGMAPVKTVNIEVISPEGIRRLHWRRTHRDAIDGGSHSSTDAPEALDRF